MATRIPAHEAAEHLASYVERVAGSGERFIVERDGQPAAALVSIDDLRRLEALAAAVPWKADAVEDPREAAYRRALEEEGLVISWPTGQPVPIEERVVVEIEGPPLSEDIIADREYRARLLAGE